MNKQGFIVIACPKCKTKNRIKSYDSNRVPVCAKCRFELVDRDQNAIYSRYGKAEEAFYDLPGIGLRGKE